MFRRSLNFRPVPSGPDRGNDAKSTHLATPPLTHKIFFYPSWPLHKMWTRSSKYSGIVRDGNCSWFSLIVTHSVALTTPARVLRHRKTQEGASTPSFIAVLTQEPFFHSTQIVHSQGSLSQLHVVEVTVTGMYLIPNLSMP